MIIFKESFEEKLAFCFVNIISPCLNLNHFEAFYLKISRAYYIGHTCVTLLLQFTKWRGGDTRGW